MRQRSLFYRHRYERRRRRFFAAAALTAGLGVFALIDNPTLIGRVGIEPGDLGNLATAMRSAVMPQPAGEVPVAAITKPAGQKPQSPPAPPREPSEDARREAAAQPAQAVAPDPEPESEPEQLAPADESPGRPERAQSAQRETAATTNLPAITNGDSPAVVVARLNMPKKSAVPFQAPRQVPQRPQSPVAAAAFDVFKAQCARCHQAPAGTHDAAADKPRPPFQGILDLRALAANKRLVQPGNPDGSLLYTMMVKREMPFDVFQTFEATNGPTAADIDAVRAWVDSLQPPPRVSSLKPELVSLRVDGATNRSFPLSLQRGPGALKKGHAITFSVSTGTACNLTLINVDTTGKATVIFPNAYDRDNAITPGAPVSIPRQGARYRFKLRDQGRERVVAICNTDWSNADGIVHDYLKQKFTYLGDYREFLATAIDRERTGRYGPAAESKRRRKWRQKRRRPRALDKRRTLPELQARTAIVIDVR